MNELVGAEFRFLTVSPSGRKSETGKTSISDSIYPACDGHHFDHWGDVGNSNPSARKTIHDARNFNSLTSVGVKLRSEFQSFPNVRR